MLSPLYADGSVIVERRVPAPALWPADSMPPTSQNHRPLRCHPPPTSGSSVCANPTYYHAVYDVRVDKCRDAPFLSGRSKAGRGPGGSLALVAADGDLLAPPVRRRGGLVDHRDVIKAHQSHKLQSTPQARRKEWELGDARLQLLLWVTGVAYSLQRLHSPLGSALSHSAPGRTHGTVDILDPKTLH